MGKYATTTSFTNLLPFFLASNSASDTTGVGIISAHIDRAEAVVNSYLVARYDVRSWTQTSASGANVPPMVRTVAEDLTSYYSIRGAHVKDGEISNKSLPDYKEIMGTLKMMADGKMALADTNGSLVATRSASMFLSNTKDFAPTFDLDDPEKWKVDQDRLSEIDGDRG